MTGKLIIFSAPSGSGKTTIVKYLMQHDLQLAFSISATTREPRGTEVHGTRITSYNVCYTKLLR